MADHPTRDYERRLVAADDLPLLGKRIIFTTPRDYAGTLSKLLIKRGVCAFWMPTIAIWPLADYSEMDAALDQLNEYNWVAFSSESGIEAFANRCLVKGLNPASLCNTKMAAMKNDGLLLERLGFRLDLKPEASTPEAITAELASRRINRGRILLPVPEVEGIPEPRIIPDWIAGLQEIGMKPHRVPAYQTAAVTSGLDMQLDLLRRGEVDVIAFTSTAEITSLLSLIDNDIDLLNKHIIACNGPGNTRAARELGLKVAIIPKQYDLTGFVFAIEDYFSP
jgi:uroporphyrinogen-III synthase